MRAVEGVVAISAPESSTCRNLTQEFHPAEVGDDSQPRTGSDSSWVRFLKCSGCCIPADLSDACHRAGDLSLRYRGTHPCHEMAAAQRYWPRQRKNPCLSHNHLP